MVANVGYGRKEMTNGIYGHKLRDKDDPGWESSKHSLVLG